MSIKHLRITKTIATNPQKVYSIWTDIEKWHLWTNSVTKISFLKRKRFEIGVQARILQPKLSPTVWTITEIIPNELFTWHTKKIGIKIIAKHSLKNIPNGTIVESELIYVGFLAPFLYKLTKKLASQYLEMEIIGLKTECEKFY